MSLALTTLLLLVPLGQEDVGLVSTSLEGDEPFVVGERISVLVELKAPQPFSGVARFELPELSGCLLVKSTERPVVGSETLAGISYFTQLHELQLYPQRAGDYRVPSFAIEFRSKDFRSSEATEHSVLTDELRVKVDAPAGGEGASITTSALTLDESWDPVPGGEVELGAAFVRTVTLSADGVPAILLPELGLERLGDLRAYSEQPSLTESAQRGTLSSTRVEQVTYVCERAGSFEMPAITLQWWDLSSGRLRSAELPARSIDVLPGPELTEPALLELQGSNGHARLGWLAAVAAALALLTWWRREALGAWWRRRREQYDESEPGRWRAVRKAAGRGAAAPTLNALYTWMSRAHPELRTLEELALALGPSPELDRQLEALQLAVLSPGEVWEGRALLRSLGAARSRHARTKDHASLEPLNPV